MNGWEDSGSRRAARACCPFGGKVNMFIQQCIAREMTTSFSLSISFRPCTFPNASACVTKQRRNSAVPPGSKSLRKSLHTTSKIGITVSLNSSRSSSSPSSITSRAPMTRMCNVPRTSIFLEVHLVALHDPNACVGLNGSSALLMSPGSLASVTAFRESPSHADKPRYLRLYVDLGSRLTNWSRSL